MRNLKDYDFPEDLKTMSDEELELLAVDIRDFLISTISRTGGHLASNLGVVELTIVLEKMFDFSRDRIIWDVGHQSYVHKILTGRCDKFETLRQIDGLSGFPRRSESVYDAFDTGHASTSLSALLGMAEARDLQGEDYATVAVIGDGSLTGGLALEGLNNLGASRSDSIVILNDNGMSISQSTGGLSRHLNKLRVSQGYYDFKKTLKSRVKKIPKVGDDLYSGLQKMRDSLKYTLVDGVLFEEFGFTYLGPVDGHDIEALTENIALAKEAEGPVLLHVITKKGKGYRNAEEDPNRFHGTGPFDPTTGKLLKQPSSRSYSEIFGNKLLDLAEKDKKIVAISAAMISATGLEPFREEYPERVFDVGIAEAHGVTFAAGLAEGGLKPVVAIYSTFLQRAYDEIMIDVCLQDLPVVFAVDRSGIVGSDGATHHGIFDYSYFGHMPNMTVLAPRDGRELEDMLEYALGLGSPCAVRYPRGEDGDLDIEHTPVADGAQVLKEGRDAEIWAAGSMVKHALKAAEILENKGIDCGIVDARYIKPLDTDALMESAGRTGMIITAEDNVLAGGFGEKIDAFFKNEGCDIKTINIAWPDKFIEHGTCEELYARYGLDAGGIAERISDSIEGKA